MRLLLLGAGFAAGVLVADRFRPGAQAVLASGALAAGCLCFAWLVQRRRPAPREGDLLPVLPPLGVAALLVGFLCLGVVDLGARLHQQASSPLPALDGRVRLLQGRLATDPRPLGRSWTFTLRSILDEDGRELPGRLAVRRHGEAPPGVVGDLVEVLVKIEALDPDDPFELSLIRRGNAAQATLLSEVQIADASPNPLIRASNFFRSRMAMGSGQALPTNRTALLLGLTIGDDRALDSRVREDFLASGLSHLTAVSGANVAIVLAAVAALLTALRLSRRVRVAAGIAVVLLFAVVTRWEPSVLRASVMAGVVLASFLFGRRSSSLHLLAAAFAGLLIFDPRLLWSVGFQLSFAATAGIILFKDVLRARLRLVPGVLAEPLALGLAAQGAVFPFVAVHFDRISLASVPANLAAAALVAPATVLGLAAGSISTMSTVAARPVFALAGLFTGALEFVARIFGRSELSQIAVPNFGGAELAAVLLAMVAGWLWLNGRRRPAEWPALAAVLLLVSSFVVPAAGPMPAGLRVTFFDVGQGDAALVESPGGARLLVDGGPDPELIADTLARRGIRRIDLVVASHLHADHVAGLEAVLSRFDVRISLHPGVKAELLESLNPHRPIDTVGEGERFVAGDLEVEFLGPSEAARLAANEAAGFESGPEGPELNDASATLRVLWGEECVLFTGDLEEGGQRELLEQHRAEIECAVLKAPHHGSAKLLEEFVEAVDPESVVVSVGRNRYGHPSKEALQLFEGTGAQVLRTDRLDDVVVEIDGEGRTNVKDPPKLGGSFHWFQRLSEQRAADNRLVLYEFDDDRSSLSVCFALVASKCGRSGRYHQDYYHQRKHQQRREHALDLHLDLLAVDSTFLSLPVSRDRKTYDQGRKDARTKR